MLSLSSKLLTLTSQIFIPVLITIARYSLKGNEVHLIFFSTFVCQFTRVSFSWQSSDTICKKKVYPFHSYCIFHCNEPNAVPFLDNCLYKWNKYNFSSSNLRFSLNLHLSSVEWVVKLIFGSRLAIGSDFFCLFLCKVIK